MERTFVPEIAVGFFQITDLSAAVNLATAWAAAVVADARLPASTAHQYVILIDAEGGNVRWRNDSDTSVAVTGTVGARLIQDTSMVYTANNISTLQFIRESASQTPKLNVQIFRHRV